MTKDTENIPTKNRRKELILIAYNHIAKRGFEGLRVHAVAAEAGINNATLHYYFPTKEDLITGVVDYLIQKFSTSNSFESDAKESPDAWKEMHAELEDARHRFSDNRDLIVVFTELLIRSLREPAIAPIFKKIDESWRGYLVSIIEQGIRQGIYRAELNPTVTATLVMLQIKGFAYQMLSESDQTNANEVLDQLVLQVEAWLSGKIKN